jgi:hypothetical protein
MLGVFSVVDIAQVVSAAAAAIAAVFSYLAIRSNKKNAAEQRAADYVKSYFELVIAHPDMWASSKRYSKEEQYESYLAYMLAMAQNVLAAHPNSQPWRKFVEEQISFNEKELGEWNKLDPSYFDIYGSEVAELVRQRLSQRKAAA